MESLQVRGILKTLSVFIKFWNFIILYDKFSSVLSSSVLCLYYLLMLIFCCLYVVYVKVSRLNNYIHRVLLKPPSTDPLTTDSSIHGPLSTYPSTHRPLTDRPSSAYFKTEDQFLNIFCNSSRYYELWISSYYYWIDK